MKNFFNKKTIIISSVVVVLVAAIVGILVYRNVTNDDNVIRYTFNETSLETNGTLTLEYGNNKEVNPIEYVTVESGTVTADVEKIYLNRVEDTKVTYTFTSKDGENSEEKTVVISVKDTKAPVITLNADNVDLDTLDGYDPTSNITSVEDPVDGPLSKLDTEPEKLATAIEGKVYEVGWYTITINEDKTVNVKACDIHGNVTEKSFTLTVPEATPEPTTESVETLWYYTAVDLGDDSAWQQLGSHYDWVYTSCSYLSGKYSSIEEALNDVVNHESSRDAEYVRNNARIFMDKDGNGNVLYYQAGWEE